MSKKKGVLPFDGIKILYANYDVVPLDEKQANLREIFGQYHAKEQVIEYDSSLKDDEIVNTLLHEISHGICHTMGIKFNSNEEEENFVNTFTAGLVTVFKDNPNILSWLMEMLVTEK